MCSNIEPLYPHCVLRFFKITGKTCGKICIYLIRVHFNPKTANHNNCRLLCHLLVILKVIFANSLDPDQTAHPHCLPVCKNRFEKFARIFSRRHKQTIFSDAGFLGILRVKIRAAQGLFNDVYAFFFLIFFIKAYVVGTHLNCIDVK